MHHCASLRLSLRRLDHVRCFFFSSRRRHTRCLSDWSSDVCSSDLKQMQAMGPLKQVLGLLPGVNAQALRGLPSDDKQLKHVEAIVLSMTPAERAEPAILNGSRRLRIAKGAGRPVQEVNRLLERFQQMKQLLKRI